MTAGVPSGSAPATLPIDYNGFKSNKSSPANIWQTPSGTAVVPPTTGAASAIETIESM